MRSRRREYPQAPFLRTVRLAKGAASSTYLKPLPLFSGGFEMAFTGPITFLVGENGSGKSTLLEAIGYACGFNLSGGNRNHRYAQNDQEPALASDLHLSWLPKVAEGFFMRAETFFNFSTYLEDLARANPAVRAAYGGESLLEQSHGESFLSLFLNKFHKGLFLLDEPEAALSPKRQLSFLTILHDLERRGTAQFLIASHSPILLTYPGATIFSLDGERLTTTTYRNTEHYALTRRFLEAPERFHRHLFDDTASDT